MGPSQIPCLLGATGCGKSEVGVVLARRTRGEIICCDAYSVYRAMPILTAAPSAPADVPHHLVGFLEASAHYDAGCFLTDCDRAIDQILERGHQPWIVGGTALYLRCWLKGFGPQVPRDEAFRRALRDRTASLGPAGLHAELGRLDPARAQQLHPNDHRRIVRALEILHLTGRPASAQRGQWHGPDRRAAQVFVLERTPADLEARIGARTRAMFEAGVLKEARRLLAGALSPEARRVLGLSELGRLLEGSLGEAQARALIVQRTRRFARKQATFFRSFEGARWIDVRPEEGAEMVAERVLEAWACGGHPGPSEAAP